MYGFLFLLIMDALPPSSSTSFNLLNLPVTSGLVTFEDEDVSCFFKVKLADTPSPPTTLLTGLAPSPSLAGLIFISTLLLLVLLLCDRVSKFSADVQVRTVEEKDFRDVERSFKSASGSVLLFILTEFVVEVAV